jgi:hypothetical protein
LEQARQTLEELVATRPPISPTEADARLARLSRAVGRQREADGELARAKTALELSQADLDEAVKRLDSLEQTRVVRPLLGRLTPSMCPRCRVGITTERVTREEQDHACSVCAEPLAGDVPDEDELEPARQALGEAEEQYATAEQELADAERRRNTASADRAAAEEVVRTLEERRPAGNEARDLETRIARLEGRLEQSIPLQETADEVDGTYAIVSAAFDEAEARRAAAAQELLSELGDEIAALARAFGIPNLETAQPKLGAQLRVRVGGADSNFSSRTGGERLRLRLATVIALLRVGSRRGIGRHPGMVLIDSPGGEEMVTGDLAAILRELSSICKELPELQLICATARTAEVREVLAEDRIMHGPDYAEVW